MKKYLGNKGSRNSFEGISKFCQEFSTNVNRDDESFFKKKMDGMLRGWYVA